MTVPESMYAMVMEAPGKPLVYKELPLPQPAAGQVLIKVIACGVCRTDLHIVDGELTKPRLPLIPGHEIIGRVVKVDSQETRLKENDLVGVPWLGYTCGRCKFCLREQENLCDNAGFTGYNINGGYAEYTVANAAWCLLIGDAYGKAASAPLLCAGLVGYRSFCMIDKSAQNIGLYGFGAAAHIITQIARAKGKNIFAFTRDNDAEAQLFAIRMGACWAGGSSDTPPEKPDAAIIFAPAGELVSKALKDVDKAGQVICGGIHMSDIPSFPYNILWEERSIKSVANLTRLDGTEFFTTLRDITVHTQAEFFNLSQANEALEKLRSGKISGAAVLVMD